MNEHAREVLERALHLGGGGPGEFVVKDVEHVAAEGDDGGFGGGVRGELVCGIPNHRAGVVVSGELLEGGVEADRLMTHTSLRPVPALGWSLNFVATTSAIELLDQVHTLIERMDSPNVAWVGGEIYDEKTIIVFYRTGEGSPTVGMFYDIGSYRYLGLDIAHDVLSDLVEPSKRYLIPDAPWGEGILKAGEPVVWEQIGPNWYPGQVPVVDERSYPPGAQWYIGFAKDGDLP